MVCELVSWEMKVELAKKVVLWVFFFAFAILRGQCDLAN